jgi:hypothetical protein
VAQVELGGHRVRHLDAQAVLERAHHLVQLAGGEGAVEHVEHRALHELAEDLVLAGVAEALHLDLAAGGGHDRAEVADPRGGHRLSEADGPLERAGEQVLVVADRHPHRDPGALADLGGAPGQVGDLGHQLLHELGAAGLHARVGVGRPLRLHDRDLVLDLARVVGADLGAEAVLERGDDAAAVGVVLRVRARHHVEGDGQPHLVAADLHVALRHDVEEAHLDALGQVGQLVEREDAAVGAGQEPVVDGQLVGEIAALGHLDRVDLADEIRDGDVGGGQLLAVAAVARDPRDRRLLALLGHPLPARGADRREGIVADLAAGQRGHFLVEEVHQEARHAGLGLAALAQEHDVLPAQHRVLDLGHHGLLVAHDAREEALALP